MEASASREPRREQEARWERLGGLHGGPAARPRKERRAWPRRERWRHGEQPRWPRLQGCCDVGECGRTGRRRRAVVPLLVCCGAGEAAGRAGASPHEVQTGCVGCLRGCSDVEAAARACCGERRRVPPCLEMYRSEIGDEKITETLR